MSEHTPGPLHTHRHATPDTSPQYGITKASGQDVGVAYTEADANLYAAAPDLLEAAIAFVRHIETLPDDTEKCRMIRLALNNRSGEQLRAAIARATGE